MLGTVVETQPGHRIPCSSLSSISDSNSLLMFTMGGNSDGFNLIHLRDADGIPSAWFQYGSGLAVESIWGMN